MRLVCLFLIIFNKKNVSFTKLTTQKKKKKKTAGEVPFPLGQYLVSVNVEFVWNFLCEQLPFTFDVQTEALGRRLAIRAGASATDFIVRRKCGSVHLGYVISNVPILTASTLDAIEWLDAAVLEAAAEAPTLVQLGQPSVVDITAGTSTCPVIFPTLVAHAIGGSCQPTSCAPGFVLTQYESADLINTCDEIITTPTPPSDSDDLSIGAIAGIVVACVVFCAIIVVVSYLIYQRYKKSTYDQNSQRHYSDSEVRLCYSSFFSVFFFFFLCYFFKS